VWYGAVHAEAFVERRIVKGKDASQGGLSGRNTKDGARLGMFTGFPVKLMEGLTANGLSDG
jgi:hypothetical protein